MKSVRILSVLMCLILAPLMPNLALADSTPSNRVLVQGKTYSLTEKGLKRFLLARYDLSQIENIEVFDTRYIGSFVSNVFRDPGFYLELSFTTRDPKVLLAAKVGEPSESLAITCGLNVNPRGQDEITVFDCKDADGRTSLNKATGKLSTVSLQQEASLSTGYR
jgi:hypothetical protein